jgi:hypothetical protein
LSSPEATSAPAASMTSTAAFTRGPVPAIQRRIRGFFLYVFVERA